MSTIQLDRPFSLFKRRSKLKTKVEKRKKKNNCEKSVCRIAAQSEISNPDHLLIDQRDKMEIRLLSDKRMRKQNQKRK